MTIKDRVYGEVEVTEPVLLDLINSSTLQRLKEIDQAGYFEPFFPGTRHSRFEHSVGVCLLLKRYGASLEEQIAGLIHDVSHSAFSHCIDYVLGAAGSEKEQSYQDNIFENFVKKTEIPAILQKYHIDLEYILDDVRFPLKETELPDLCADRIDYSLRAALVFGEVKSVTYFLDNIVAEGGCWIFKDFESGKKYAELFSKINTTYFAGFESAAMFQTLGDYLRYALAHGYISVTDLYMTDKEVLNKIGAYHKEDPQLQLLFNRMNDKKSTRNNPNNFDVEVFCKSRIVDPLCKHQGEVKRVSEVDPGWGVVVREELKPKHYYIEFER